MNIIIPLGGLGQRFKDAGYDRPKPLIRVFGKEIIRWLLDSLNHTHIDRVIIPYNKELARYNFEGLLRAQYPQYRFVFSQLQRETAGAVDTICSLLREHRELLAERAPVICMDGDNFYTCDVLDGNAPLNSVYYHSNTDPNPIYSYLQLDENRRIVEIEEKNKISHYACTGIYRFESFEMLERYAAEFMSGPVAGECYMSKLVGYMIRQSVPFIGVPVEPDQYVCLGTPLQLRCFYNNYPLRSALKAGSVEDRNQPIKLRVCFDLDGTLVTEPRVVGNYSTVEPISHMINYAKYLKKMGSTIIIQTARRMRTHGGNEGKVLADIGRVTFDTLERFGIPYDEVYFGKPFADVYLDDKAVNAFGDYEKALGYYATKIEPRAFNTLTSDSAIGVSTAQVFKKSRVGSGTLEGEIHFYRNMPESIKDIFPILFNYDVNGSWYEMERISGVTASELLISESLTSEILGHILSTLERIHGSVHPEKDEPIYANYSAKLKERFEGFDYSRFSGANQMYKEILDGLDEYEKSGRAMSGVIHGDPVFTNIIINTFGKIKMIDMRGMLGGKLSIFGDVGYDLAKIYQSLLGYDEILLGHQVGSTYKRGLLRAFEKYVLERFGADRMDSIRLITRSLIFSLIPLHEEANRERLYSLLGAV